jgi:hypothetical protein
MLIFLPPLTWMDPDTMMVRLDRRALLAGLVGACRGALPAWGADQAGAVNASRGECFAEAATGRRVLAPAAAVFVGDSVGTGSQSALGLHLGAATEVRLGAEARLRIDRFLVNAGGVLVLERGALLYDHNADSGPSDVTVRGPYGLVAVRGTKFFAGPSNGEFGVFVERGSVTVVGGRTAVLVVSGSGTNLATPGAEPTMPAPWGAGRIAAAMASVS